MTTEQFAYWLQGFAEVNGGTPTDEQWKVIKDHLQLVFHKVTPVRNDVITVPSNWPKSTGIYPYDNLGTTLIC